MIANARYLIVGLVCLFIGVSAYAEDVWISDQFEVMLRTGPSTTNAIERMLPSGTPLEAVERDDETGYTRVRTANGAEGWVLSRYIMTEPGAREQQAGPLSQSRPKSTSSSAPSPDSLVAQRQANESASPPVWYAWRSMMDGKPSLPCGIHPHPPVDANMRFNSARRIVSLISGVDLRVSSVMAMDATSCDFLRDR